MSFNTNPNGRVTIKLKPRAPLRASGGAADIPTNGSGETLSSTAINPFNTVALAAAAAAAATPNSAGVSAAATCLAVSIPPAHSPESLARSSPFWPTAIGMLDVVLDADRTRMVMGSKTTVGTAPQQLPAKYTYGCEDVCTSVRCICDLGASEALYKELHTRLSAFIAAQVEALVQSFNKRSNDCGEEDNCGGVAAIEGVVNLWSAVISNVTEISTVFMYLDRRYVLQETREGSIFNLGVFLFKSEIMFRGRSITARANQGFLKLLDEDRAREQQQELKKKADTATTATSSITAFSTQAQQLARYRDMSLAVQLYFTELEPLIVAHSQKVFTDLGNRLLMGDDGAEEDGNDDNAAANNGKTPAAGSSNSSAASSSDEDSGMTSGRTFFLGAERIIQSEHRRMTRYLDPRSRAKLDEALQARLVKPFVPELFEKDFAKLVAQDRLPDIARGFQLMCLRHVNEKDKAKKTFSAFVKKWASKFVSQIGTSDDAADDAFIPNVIALDQACDVIINKCFTPGFDEEFQSAKTAAFEAALQDKEQRVSQMLVKFMDSYLRNNGAAAAGSPTSPIHAALASSPRVNNAKPTVVIIGQNNANKANKNKKHKKEDVSATLPPITLYAHATPTSATPAIAGRGEFPLKGVPSGTGLDSLATPSNTVPSVPAAFHQTEADVTAALDGALRIFVYMPSKDIFEAFYLREFANRVLLRRSASTDRERYVIAMLRGLCGSQLTKQLEGMLRDLDASLTQTDIFRRMVRDREAGRIDDSGQPVKDDAEEANDNAAQQKKDAAAAANPARKEEKKLLPPCPKTTSAEGSLLLHTTVSTLTQSFWPFFDTFTPSPKYFPAQCTAVMAQFEAFYAQQFRQRSLTWVHALAQCTVRACYGPSVQTQLKDFHGSFLQGLILAVCFDSAVKSTSASTEMTFGEIIRRVCNVDEATGAPVATSVGVRTNPSAVILAKSQTSEAAPFIIGTKLTAEQFLLRQLVVCAVMGLLTPKIPILLRGAAPPEGQLDSLVPTSTDNLFAADIKDTDVFRVNTLFAYKQRSIRVPQILPRDNRGRNSSGAGGASGGPMGALGGATDETLLKKLESQRQYLLDATVAKVMKARNTCGHGDLCNEVLKTVANRFASDISHVKVRIEELLKRGFIERDANDSSVYHFKP